MSDSPISPLSVVSVFFGPISKLREVVKKYLKKKKIENLFIKALDTEATAYIDTLEEMSEYSRDKIKPALLDIKGPPTPTQITAIMEVAAEVPLQFINLLTAFINLARACSEVSKIDGFMKALEETNLAQYDFVNRLAAIYVPENSIKVDGSFFRYFKMYQEDFPKPPRDRAYDELEDIRKSIKYIKTWVENARIRKPRIARKICKRYIKNMKQLVGSLCELILDW